MNMKNNAHLKNNVHMEKDCKALSVLSMTNPYGLLALTSQKQLPPVPDEKTTVHDDITALDWMILLTSKSEISNIIINSNCLVSDV